MIPCKDCITLAVCNGYLSARHELYMDDIAWVNYNCVSLYGLQHKCIILKDYFPCYFDDVFHPNWYEGCGISTNEWYSRYNEFVKFYQKFWIIE